jgi:hypothetical protein
MLEWRTSWKPKLSGWKTPLIFWSKGGDSMADDVIMAYCVKEKAQKQMNDAKEVTLKNGKHAMQGVCSSCGTKMMKFVSTKKSESSVPPAPAA